MLIPLIKKEMIMFFLAFTERSWPEFIKVFTESAILVIPVMANIVFRSNAYLIILVKIDVTIERIQQSNHCIPIVVLEYLTLINAICLVQPLNGYKQGVPGLQIKAYSLG